MDTLQVAGMISKELKRSGVAEKAPLLASNIAMSFSSAGLKLCDLKPLAELLGCEPEMGAIKDATHSLLGTLVSANRRDEALTKPLIEMLGCEPELKSVIDAFEKRASLAIAQVLNWERTEFDTLDELMEELRKYAARYADLAGIRAEREAADPTGCEAFLVLHEVCKRVGLPPMGFEELAARLRTTSSDAATHTLLHAGELYRDVTILLRTEQLVAWRTADGQEYSAKAHRVTLDPDEDGLAAAILSRIAGVEIAPEHMAELRAQMAGGVAHG